MAGDYVWQELTWSFEERWGVSGYCLSALPCAGFWGPLPVSFLPLLRSLKTVPVLSQGRAGGGMSVGRRSPLDLPCICGPFWPLDVLSPLPGGPQ